MSKYWVWVEAIQNPIDGSPIAVRIFRNHKQAQEVECYVEMPRRLAISQIRDAIRTRQNSVCARCPNLITQSFHMHEKVSRGRGGEISLDNSEGLCADCHIGPRGAHSNRLPQFTKSTERNNR